MHIFNLSPSKLQRIQRFNNNCFAIEAYIIIGQPERALPYLAELQKLYIDEIRKIINLN